MDTWIADCFVRHAWYALSVSFRGKFLAEGSWNFDLVQLFLDSWIAECFVRHVWYALSVFSGDGKFLLEAVGILSILGHLDCRLFR